MGNYNSPVLHVVQPREIFVRKLVAIRTHNIEQNKRYQPAITTKLDVAKDDYGLFCSLSITIKGKKAEEFPFNLDIELVARFRFGDKASDQANIDFLARQGTLLLWPFARTYIIDTINKLGLPPYMLPFIDADKTPVNILAIEPPVS